MLCILEIASTLMGIVGNVMTNPSETVALIVLALQLPMSIAIIAYSIRVYFGICDVYGKPRSWVWLWVFVDGVVALIWGILPDFRPSWQVEDLRKQVKEIFGGHNVAGMSDGLTVNLEERTAKDLFSKKYLLRDIHMYIHPGHMVLLLGGSGAGKTTFLNAVNGYEKAKAKVTLNGSDVYGEYKKMQYEVGFVPQQELMRGKDTVFSTLMDASLLRIPIEVSASERRARVEEVMKIFGIAPVKGSLVDKLSGGQKKRLSIAMEFLSNPSLFILFSVGTVAMALTTISMVPFFAKHNIDLSVLSVEGLMDLARDPSKAWHPLIWVGLVGGYIVLPVWLSVLIFRHKELEF